MPPKRVAVTVSVGSPAKRQRRVGVIGAATQGDDTARLIAAHHLAEHAGHGQSYLSRRAVNVHNSGAVKPLSATALQVSAQGLLELLKLPGKVEATPGALGNVGWDKDREATGASTAEVEALRTYVKSLPETLANRLLASVVALSAAAIESSEDAGGISVLALANMFLHERTTALSLSNLSAPALLISRIPQCTNLVSLDLSTHLTLKDGPLAKILSDLKSLEKINLRGCTKIGDASVIALSKGSESRLKEVNLSLTAVTVKGLKSLFARCSALEVLKLANVQGLNERAISSLIQDSTNAAIGWRHVPLSNLRTLKLRSCDVTDASLGRLLGLCALTLQKLDISYTLVKSLDILAAALHATPKWRLEKLVASGLPLTAATLAVFLRRLAEDRPDEERRRFKTLKLGAIPSTATKQPGLNDAVLHKLMPYLERLDGLEKISLFQNWDLGKKAEPMSRFIEVIGRRCKFLDLTLSLQDYHLDGLFPPLDGDGGGIVPDVEPPRIQTLVLDSSRITDGAAAAISECRDLRSLHVAETRISTRFMATLMASCPLLSNVNLTSCRGIPVTQRRTFFEAWEKGEVVVDEL